MLKKYQNKAKFKDLLNAISEFQTTPKNTKIVKLGIENTNLRTQVCSYNFIH